MKIKVFFILSFSPKYEFVTDDSTAGAIKVWYNKEGKFIGVWDKDWAHIIGNRIIRIDRDIDFTVLRADKRADKLYEYVYDSGLKHISFPSKMKLELYGLKYAKSEYSKKLIDYLYDLYKKSEKFIIILPFERSYFFKSIINKFKNKIPIINPHFTNNSCLLPSDNNLKNPFRYVHRFILNKQLGILLKNVKYVTLGHKKYREQINKRYNIESIIYSAGFEPSEWQYQLQRENERRNLNITDDKYMILASSRLTPEKQIDKLILTLSKFRNKNFICYITGAGENSYRNTLNDLIISNGLREKINLTGFVTNEQLAKYYCASDIFIMSSIQEAGPGSTNIAIWYGVPIISTDTGFTSELLKENNAGIVVPTTDYIEWEKAFKKFFDGEYIKPLEKEILLQNKGAEVNIKRLINFIKQVYNNFYKTNI